MDKRVKAIVLKTKDLGEADKTVTLLTAEEGKITAVAKSVKKAKAKLKFAVEPFCFGEYELTKTRGSYVLTGCELYELFYGLRGDIERFYLASTLTEITDAVTEENDVSADELVFLVRALDTVTNAKSNAAYLAIKLILQSLSHAGYGISDFNCLKSGKEIVGKAYFVFDSCAFYSEEFGEGKTAVSKKAFELIKLCVKTEVSEIEKIPYDRDSALEVLRLLYKLIYYKLYFKSGALAEFAKLL